jgi:NAD(P)H-hydrate epimerase
MPDSRLPNDAVRASGCVLTRADVRSVDQFTIDNGIESIELMERAGIELTASILRVAPEPARVLILAGSGNNGGDGYVIARLLLEEQWDVSVVHLGREPRKGGECAINQERWIAAGGMLAHGEHATAMVSDPGRFDLVVDALFGTGLDRAIDGKTAEVIDALNNTPISVFAIDIPSGLDADTGIPLGACVQADITATIGAAKPGLFLAAGPDWAGRVEVLDIALASPRSAGVRSLGSVLDAASIAPLIPPLDRTAHKGTRGHVLIVGGSAGKSGAAVLAARAALRSGAGLVTLGVPVSIAAQVDAMLPEAMTMALADDGDGKLAQHAWQAVEAAGISFDTVAIGPGLGTDEGTELFVADALQHFNGSLILDADALNVLAQGVPDLRTRLARRRTSDGRSVILTPHPGEMARLVGTDTGTIQADRAGIASAFAKSHEAVVLLKGAGTLVAENTALAFNTSGNPGMAAAGMGDVLTGVTAVMAARIRPAYDAACVAAYVHGKAGDLAAARIGTSGFMAGEVADLLPNVLDWLSQ